MGAGSKNPPSLVEQAADTLRKGEYEDALAQAEALLARSPEMIDAQILRINAANALGDYSTAIDGLEGLLRRFPGHPKFVKILAAVLNRSGSRLRESGQSAEAAAVFGRAVTLQPDHPHGWFNLALSLRDLDRIGEARAAMRHHLSLFPTDQSARLIAAGFAPVEVASELLAAIRPGNGLDRGWYALAAAKAGMAERAAETLHGLTPEDDLGSALEAATELRVQGAADPAIQAGRSVARLARRLDRPSLRAEMISALALPAVAPSAAAIVELRRRFELGLDELDDRWTDGYLRRADNSLRQLSHGNFFLAYHGENDRLLQRRFAALVTRAGRTMRPDLCGPIKRRPGRPRVGLLSSCWRNCTVGAYFGGWLRWLREAGYETFLVQLGPQRDSATDRLAAQADHFHFSEERLDQLVCHIRALQLDLLILPEAGMDARMTPFLALRLARRHAVAWGHPVTSGFSGVDAFLSCAEMEPLGAELHYEEPLTLLPGLGVDYTRPALPMVRPRAELGLPDGVPLVLLPQSIFKLHPDGDAVLAGVAARVPDARFVLFSPEHAVWRTEFEARVEQAFRAAGQRVDGRLLFQPLCHRERYLQINQACDVMLDSLHWSGGNTTIDALQAGLPVVTTPGRFMRGRQSVAMLGRLGLSPSLVMHDADAMVERTVALLGDREERSELRRCIADRLDQLFESACARSALLAEVARLTR